MKELDVKDVDWIDIERGAIKEFDDKSFIQSFNGSKSLKDYLKGQSQYSENENGNYNFVDPSHVSMTINVNVDISLFDLEKGNVKEPNLDYENMGNAEVYAVSENRNVVFSSECGMTEVSREYLIDAIRVFGVPDKILCGEDYPLVMYFGDIKYLLAPRIGSGDGYETYYRFDFKQWCPQLYGIKPKDITGGQLLSLIHSSPLDSTIESLIKKMNSLRISEEKTQNTEDFF